MRVSDEKSPRPKALAIAGEPAVRDPLRIPLDRAEIDLVEADTGVSGLRRFYVERPDVVVLELKLPDLDGFDVLARIKALSDVPVVAVVGSGGEGRVLGLRAGADDCVSKPALAEEVVARIEALLRRRRGDAGAPDVIEDDFLQIDRAGHRVTVMGLEIDLTPTEFRMLETFAGSPGRVLGHGQLLDEVWGDRIRGRDEVKLYVSYLRRKLSVAGLDPVETVRGVGYRYAPRRLRPATG
ncbi:MAG: response regulator transcription factor [Actinobacteria bacterium]|nr:response regulator transcription factor [Actinomycetota bacterium]